MHINTLLLYYMYIIIILYFHLENKNIIRKNKKAKMLINNKLIFCILIISFQYYQVSSFFQFLSSVLGVWDMIENVITKATTAVDLINGKSGDSWQDESISLLNQLVTKNNEISDNIKEMDKRIDGRLDNIERLIKSIPDKVQKDSFMTTFTHSIRVIDETYEELIEMASRKKLRRSKVQNFIKNKIRSSNGVEELLQTIFHTVTTGKISRHEKSLLTVLTNIENTDVDEKMCENMPPQLSLYELFMTILGIEVIGVTTMIYGLSLNELDKKGSEEEEPLEDEIHDIIKKQEKRMNTYTSQFSRAMKSLKRSFHNCDKPNNLTRDVTFTEMRGLIQEIVIGEYNLKKRNQCTQSCSDVNNIHDPSDNMCYVGYLDDTDKSTIPTEFVNSVPKKQAACPTNRQCHGTLSRCILVSSANICMAKEEKTRYHWIKSDNKIFGKEDDCKNGTLINFPQRKYTIRREYVKCSYCLCTCYDNNVESKSVNVISLKSSRSDTQNNRVIVGMRFKIYEDILHIEIKDAKIIKDYDVEDVKWVKLPDMKTNVYNTRKNTDNVFVDGKDFTAFSRETAFNFDEIQFEYGRVLTGVRFSLVTLEGGDMKRRIQIQAESMEYDIKTGDLQRHTEKWHEPSADNHETKFEYNRDQLPHDVKEVLVIDSNTKQYAVFEELNRDKTAGQATVPFLDAQTLETNPPSPFSGVGFHHRGAQKSTGKFGLTGYSIDLAQYFENYETSEKLQMIKDKYQKKK